MTSGQRDRVKYFRATTSTTRRKWSDWSECSESCLRTRHRLNCDDLTSDYLTAGQSRPRLGPAERATPTSTTTTNGNKQVAGVSSVTSITATTTAPIAKSQALVGLLPAELGARNLQVRDNSNKNQQLDDDQDYADEGDEDDEDDSCATVEPSRTFEEQACFVGQCKQQLAPSDLFRSALQPTQLSGHQTPAKIQNQQQQQRTRSKAHANGYNQATSLEPKDTRLPHLDPAQHQQNHHQYQHKQQLWPAPSSDLVSMERASNQTTATGWTQGRTQIELGVSGTTTSPGGVSTDSLANASDPWLSTPRSMWNLSAGQSPANTNGSISSSSGMTNAHLVQLSVLTGALLSLALLTIFLVRRLFIRPATKETSYNWMLASQRRGHKGKLQSASACCHHGLEHHGLLEPSPGRLCCPSLAKLSSSSGATSITTEAIQDHHNHHNNNNDTFQQQQQFLVSQRLAATSASQQQQQLCYLWERQRLAGTGGVPTSGTSGKGSSFVASLGHLAQQFGPSKSRKLDYANQPYFVDLNGHHFVANQRTVGGGGSSSTATSASSRSAALKSPNSSQPMVGQRHFLDQTFDALYIEPNIVQGLGGCGPTNTLDYDQVYNYDTLELADTERASSQLAGRNPKSTTFARHQTAGLIMNKQPPNVPSSTCSNGQHPPGLGLGSSRRELHEGHHSPSGSIGRRASSGSSSMSGGGGSSASIQSVTAQLLSNETTGSSLDQAPEILDCPSKPVEMPSSSTSQHRRHETAQNTARGTPRLGSASSQPNSPHLKAASSSGAAAASTKRQQFKLSNSDRSTPSKTKRQPPERHQTSGCDSDGLNQQQQHFYEEIGRK